MPDERSPALAAAELDEYDLFDPAAYAAVAGLPDDGRRAGVLGVLAWSVPAVLTAVVVGVRIGTPSLWADELVTSAFVRLRWSDVMSLTQHTDAALVPYYGMLRGWTAIAGNSDVALRLPSLLAVAAAAAIVGRIGTRVATPRVGLLSGVLFALLPVTSRFGQEARPYAIALLAATAAGLALLRVLEEATPARLAVYALSVVILGLAHPLALALLVAHGFAVVALRPQIVGRWAVAAGLGALPAVPLVVAAYGQRERTAWIATADSRSPLVFAGQFVGTPTLAAAVGMLALLAISPRRPALIPSAWALLPLGVLLAADQLAVPVWLPRYALFVLPAFVLLVGLTTARAPLPVAVLVLTLLAALGLPQQVAERQPDGHGLDAATAAHILIDGTRPGDVAVYAADVSRQWLPRDVVARYVPSSRRPADVLLVHPQRKAGREFAVECADVERCLGQTPRVWLVRAGEHPDALDDLGPRLGGPLQSGYVIEQAWTPTGLTVALLVRKR